MPNLRPGGCPIFINGDAMKITIAGGCGDTGRNSFFVEGERHAFIVDAGTSTDGFERPPDITQEQARRAEYLFITHSHKDHTGAIERLVRLGFSGPVLMTNQTYRQMKEKPAQSMILDSTCTEISLLPGLSFSWGRTGHCAGAVWYLIKAEDKNLFFSGDYREDDPFYRSDPVRNVYADLAVIDAAYSSDVLAGDLRRQVVETVKELTKEGTPLLLPVPHYGRGLSMALTLRLAFPDRPIALSEKLHRDWLRLGHRTYFANPAALELPFETFSQWDGTVEAGGLYFLTDAQLAKAKSRTLIDTHPELAVLLTGHIHGYGNAGAYVKSGRAKLSLWPNHMSKKEMLILASKNTFKRIIPFHNRNEPYETDSVIF